MYPAKSAPMLTGNSNAVGGINTAAADVTVLEQHVGHLNAASNDVESLADRLHQIADRVFGQRPAATGKSGAENPAIDSSLGRLSSSMSFNEYVRGKLRDAVERLESL